MRAVPADFLVYILINRTCFNVNWMSGETGYIMVLCTTSAGENGNTPLTQTGLFWSLFCEPQHWLSYVPSCDIMNFLASSSLF